MKWYWLLKLSKTSLKLQLSTKGLAIYIVHLNRYFVISPWCYLVVTFLWQSYLYQVWVLDSSLSKVVQNSIVAYSRTRLRFKYNTRLLIVLKRGGLNYIGSWAVLISKLNNKQLLRVWVSDNGHIVGGALFEDEILLTFYFWSSTSYLAPSLILLQIAVSCLI